MQPLAVLRSSQFQIQHSSPNELRPQILIRNSWLVCARINRRSLRVSLCSPFLHAVLSWSSTFLIACHSAFKLLRRGPCCESERERERGREENLVLAVDRPRSAYGQPLHAKRQTHARGEILATKGTPHRRVCLLRGAAEKRDSDRERERERERSKLGHCWCEGFNMLRQ